MTDPADSSRGKRPSKKPEKGKQAQAEEHDEEQPPQYDPSAPPGTLVADYETLVPDFFGDALHIHVDVESLLRSALSPTFHYVVTTSEEKHLGSIHETDHTLGRLLSGGRRSFTADISDTNGCKILKVDRRVKLAGSEMYVYAYSRQPHEPIKLLGKVKKNFAGVHRRYTVSIALVNDMFGELFKLEAPAGQAWVFGAQNGSGQECAVVARRRTHLGDITHNRTRPAVVNAAHLADRFDLHFVGRPEKQAPQEPVRPLERALLLSSAILIDLDFQLHTRRAAGSGMTPGLFGSLI